MRTNEIYMLPLVSVIIPTYNYAQYICEAVNSVLTQEYPVGQIEIIIVDDGSTDNTQGILQPFIDKGSITYYHQQNKGKASATNYGIQHSNGKYIFNLDADDFFLPNKIAASVNVFETDTDIVHVASAAQCLWQDSQVSGIEDLPVAIVGKVVDGNWLLEYFYNNKILFGGGSTYAAKASVLKKIQIPDAVDMYIDEFLLLAILPLGKSFFVGQPLSVWRIHTSNYSGKTSSIKKRANKGERLLESSSAVLAYLEDNIFNARLIKIYRLQHVTRQVVFKESVNDKKASDILHYATEVFFRIRPGWLLIRKHNVINRLIPTFLLRFLRKVK
jgi:glycosyltransferase involved in cell wall biosynthesis